jgi:L-alanine-DL-glutamate epimerase-like enolase superfamily enzyme
MNSRQRVLKSFHHQTPDRVALDFCAVPEMETLLMKELQVPDREALLERLHVDFRHLDKWGQMLPRYVGPYVKLMVDANSQWDLPTAIRLSHRLKDFDVYWMEEPLAADDVTGHAALARSGPTPIALGEQLTKLDEFSRFIRADAVHYVQADAVRLAGITEWWQTADLALGCRLPVVAHVADMMQVHLHLSIAHPACRLLEYIPWARDCFEEPATVKDGLFVAPETPGAGTTLKPDALEKYGVG